MIEVVTGSLFDAKEKYLCHQTNCVTNRAAHLSKDVFKRFPYADIYTPRKEPDKPGTIIVRGNGQDQRFVINILGQYYPGTPRYPDSDRDGYEARKSYFLKALHQISKIPDLQSLAFPYKIACGAAGGDWNAYLDMLTRFANYVEKAQGAKVVIYKLPE